MDVSRRRERAREYREMVLGIACTLFGIGVVLGAGFLVVWAIVALVE
jgi:hypothetical protein